jgi:hypothetical protein
MQRLRPDASLPWEVTSDRKGLEVRHLSAWQVPVVEPHLPVNLPPPAARPFVGRDAERRDATDRLGDGEPVEISGAEGLGKTWLLRTVAGDVGALPDGVLNIDASYRDFAEVRSRIYESIYWPRAGMVAAQGVMDVQLRPRRLLVVIDDVALEQDAARLRRLMPDSVLLLASEIARLDDEDSRVVLAGLDAGDAIAIVEHALRRALTTEEREAATAFAVAVRGHPMSLKRAAGALRRGGDAVDLGRFARAADPRQRLDHAQWEALEDDERKILALLRLLGPAPLAFEHIGAIARVADVPATTDALQALGLAQTHSPRASATFPVFAHATEREDAELVDAGLAYFGPWLDERRAADPGALADASSVLKLLEGGAARGRWLDVLLAARGLERVVALGSRWGAWESALDYVERAGIALGDDEVLGWVAHERGVRAVLLGQPDADGFLRRACEIRRRLPDNTALMLSERTLRRLVEVERPAEPSPAKYGEWLAAAVLFVLAALSARGRPRQASSLPSLVHRFASAEERRGRRRSLARLLLVGATGAGLALALSEGLRKKVLDLLFGAEEESEFTARTSTKRREAAAASGAKEA